MFQKGIKAFLGARKNKQIKTGNARRRQLLSLSVRKHKNSYCGHFMRKTDCLEV